MSGYVLEFTNLGLHPLINQGKWKEKRFFAFRNNCSPSISNQGCCFRLCVGELKAKAGKSQGPGGSSGAGATKEEEEEEGNFQLLMAVKSSFNDILIVDTPKSRMLLLDSTHNVHSILYKDQKWTGSYWDEFASLPAIVPKGPIAIFGLGGGTAAHLMLDLWPSLQLEGWEIDGILIDKAREYLGLSDLEKRTVAGGILNVHIGDALSKSVNVSGGYAGIIIDLFSGGQVLPQLQEVTTWLELENKLMPNGRLMVNCGGINEASVMTDGMLHPRTSSIDDTWVQNSTIKSLTKAFPGKVWILPLIMCSVPLISLLLHLVFLNGYTIV
ncbi:putative spermidine synthase [Morella rubra]|uniref:Putative spermidine synthase n=1 Tax=Morella rubra TaxID=262757 RepID=A0A6A1VJ23_9ROSI|nr:putative spermidine synthase [Morella rubra]KAB1212912.1 putative spermidine synthase [Morella rubra]KAB1212914.1 putative spermidine synthase [Morella rubra]